MDKFITLLQSVQDIYAAESGMCLVVTGGGGRWITRPSGRPEWSRRMEDSERPGTLSRELLDIMAHIPPLGRPVDYEYRPGIKVMVAPFEVEGAGRLYVWAAFFTETRARRLLLGYYGDDRSGEEGIRDLRDFAPELNGERKRKLAEKIGGLAEIASMLMTADGGRMLSRRRMAAVREMSSFIDRPGMRLRDALQQYFYLQRGLDFLGYAEKLDETRFQIRDILGEGGVGLTGAVFSMGEGFLGQSATTRQAGNWQNIGRDPRSLFFTQNNVHPQALFCFPVIRDGTVAGLLFGGSRTLTTIPEEMIDFGHTLAALLGAQLAFQDLRAARNANFLRLSMLMEIGRSVTMVQDVKRVLFILIDMSLNLVQGAFSAVLIKLAGGKAQMLSRGLPQGQVEPYIKELSKRYDGYAPENAYYGKAVLTEWEGVPVLESPLVYRCQLLGILCVALKQKADFEDYRDFMLTLSIAGSGAIHRIREEEQPAHRNAVSLLALAARQWNPEGAEAAERAKRIAEDFAREEGLRERDVRLAGEACLLSLFDPGPFEGLLERELSVVMEEIKTIRRSVGEGQTGEAPFRQASQIAAMALEHARNGRGVRRLPAVDYGLRERFTAYLARKEVVDLEVSLGETAAARAREEQRDPMQAIRDMNLLSSREQEVLGLVATGASNREIAEKLFISEHTVKNHMTNIFHKLGVGDRSQLIAKVYQLGYS